MTSHREGRDSDSKRHRSRFDREPSPKRSRKDGKPAPEKVPTSNNNLDTRNQTDQDQKHGRRVQDGGLPLETPLTTDLKLERGAPSNEPERKPNGQHEGTKHSSNSSEVSRPWSYFQHDERGNSTQLGRSSGRGATGDGGRWRDSRDQHNERTESKTASNDTWRRDDRAKEEKGSWRQDAFFEMQADAPPARKRPAFREKKIEVKSENTDGAATKAVKPTHPERAAEESGKEVRGYNTRHFDRSDKPFAGDRATNRREPQRAGFSPRDRYRAGGSGDRNYRGRERFSGEPGFHGSGTRVEKWKHDLYHEANRSPTPKNEEDQIAKLEALLAS